jgi:hypothetical protein
MEDLSLKKKSEKYNQLLLIAEERIFSRLNSTVDGSY